jgi:hypothetical protein
MNTATLLTTIIAPQFASLDSSVITGTIELVALELDAASWGTLYQRGVALLAAHVLELAERGRAAGAGGSASGPIVGRKAGDLQVNYGAALGVLSADATYATTPFGLEFLRLRQQLGSFAFASNT